MKRLSWKKGDLHVTTPLGVVHLEAGADEVKVFLIPFERYSMTEARTGVAEIICTFKSKKGKRP